MDRLTAWHRWVGFTLLWTVAHARHARRARLRDARRASGVADVPRAGRGGRLAARDVRRGDHRRDRGVSPCGTPAGGCRTRPGTPFTSASTLAILLALVHQLLEGTTFTSSAVARAYWWTLWALVLGALRGRAGSSCRCGATPTTGSGSPRSCRSPTTWCRCTSPAATSTGCRPGRASSASGGSPGTTAGGRPTRSRCRPRPTGGRCGSPPRPSARPAPGCATSRSGPASFVEGPYGAFTALHQAPDATLLDRRRRRDHARSAPCWRRSTGPGRRALPGAHHGRRRAAARAAGAGPPARRAAARARRPHRQRQPAVRARSSRTTSPPWCPTSPTATCSSAVRRR